MAVQRQTRSICPYCGVGCGVIIESTGEQITAVRGDPDHPANFGRLCTKGSTLAQTASAPITRQTRLLQPLLRAERGGVAHPVSWGDALDRAARAFAQTLQIHGPDAVGFYVSGQLLTEDYYVFNKLAKGLIGTNNIDTNSRLCMSSAVAGYKQTLGADAPPACYDDLQHAQCVFIAGANPAFAHPILFRRLEDAKRANPPMKVIVVDPRRTHTTDLADLILPLQPGTDVLLFNGLLHIMAAEGWLDRAYIDAHTEGFDAIEAIARTDAPARVAQLCGIPQADLLQAARWFSGLWGATGTPRKPTLSLYCQGLNQSSSGTAKNAALINLHLATGQIGKAGAGPFSLTGQTNAMGGREVGGLANLLSAHRDLANPAHRAEVARLWGVPDVPAKPGKTAVEMFQAAADGEIKALWIACTNPAQSLPDQATVRRALQRAEFVVLQEAFATTATLPYADLLLPATTWGEKEGTVTNSERRINRVRAAVPPPHAPGAPRANAARADWQIVVDFAQRLQARGVGQPSTRPLFDYPDAESIWNEHRESTRGRDLDITGLSYALLDAQGPQQWPYPSGNLTGLQRLYADGVFATENGRARFAPTPYQPLAEPCDARYPLALSTGRLRDQWHGMSRTGTLGRLFGHVAEPVLSMHPHDLSARQLADGDLAYVTSRRASVVVAVQASAEQALGQVFLPMHWGCEYLGGRSSTGHALAGVNALTSPACCPTSHQPELKHAAVKVLKAELPWSLLGMAWIAPDRAWSVREQLKELMPLFPYASCTPFGQERCGVLFRASAHDAPPAEVLDQLETLLGLDAQHVLRYADPKRGQRRAMQLVRVDARGGEARLNAFLLAGDTRAQTWIRTLLQDELPAQSYGRQLLQPSAKPPAAVPSPAKQVCACFNVTETAIVHQLNRCIGSLAERLGQLQSAVRCGTNCGSCLPEVKRLVRAHAPAAG